MKRTARLYLETFILNIKIWRFCPSWKVKISKFNEKPPMSWRGRFLSWFYIGQSKILINIPNFLNGGVSDHHHLENFYNENNMWNSRFQKLSVSSKWKLLLSKTLNRFNHCFIKQKSRFLKVRKSFVGVHSMQSFYTLKYILLIKILNL